MKKSLWIWASVGVIGLAIFLVFYSHAFPIASIDVRISKKEAIGFSSDFIRAQGFELEDFNHAIIFYSDYDASVYLQKNQGIKRSNELIREGIPVWFWRVRWFKELEKDGFLTYVDPATGEIIFFHHFILESDEGERLTRSQALSMARDQAKSHNVVLKEYELKDSTTKRRDNRTDHKFTWELKDYSIDEAKLRLDIDVYGNTLGRYKRYLKVPEEFRRYINKELSFGRMLTTAVTLARYLLIISAVFMLFFKTQQGKATWKIWLIFGATASVALLLRFFNSTSLWWSFYPDTMSKAAFITESFGVYFTHVLSIGLIVLACGALGELSSNDSLTLKMPLISAIKSGRADRKKVLSVCIVGYGLGFAFLGYITLFYLIGVKFFDIWIPPSSEYSNIFGLTLPFLFPLTIAIAAAVREEMVYRFFATTFLKRFTKKLWLALLIPSLIWGFAHSFYHVFPTYIRGIELTLFGIVLSIVFLRYGIESVIIAHFVINATIASLPLLRSHNTYFLVSGMVVILIALTPFSLLMLRSKEGNNVKKRC